MGAVPAYRARSAPIPGPSSLPTGNGQVASYNLVGGLPVFAGWITPVNAAGVSGGQTIYGGTGASERLNLYGTSHSTPGSVAIRNSRLSIYDGIGIEWASITSVGGANFATLQCRGVVRAIQSSYRHQGPSAIGIGYDQTSIDGAWADNTDATRKGRLVMSALDYAGSREGVRVEADGTAARLGFFGAGAAAKPTVSGSHGSNAALQSLLTALATLGLITDSTTT